MSPSTPATMPHSSPSGNLDAQSGSESGAATGAAAETTPVVEQSVADKAAANPDAMDAVETFTPAPAIIMKAASRNYWAAFGEWFEAHEGPIRKAEEPENQTWQSEVVAELPYNLKDSDSRKEDIYPDFLPTDYLQRFPLDIVPSDFRGKDLPDFPVKPSVECQSNKKIEDAVRPRPAVVVIRNEDLNEVFSFGHIGTFDTEQTGGVDPRDLSFVANPYSQRPQFCLDIVTKRDETGKIAEKVQWTAFGHAFTANGDRSEVGLSFGYRGEATTTEHISVNASVLAAANSNELWVAHMSVPAEFELAAYHLYTLTVTFATATLGYNWHKALGEPTKCISNKQHHFHGRGKPPGTGKRSKSKEEKRDRKDPGSRSKVD